MTMPRPLLVQHLFPLIPINPLFAYSPGEGWLLKDRQGEGNSQKGGKDGRNKKI